MRMVWVLETKNSPKVMHNTVFIFPSMHLTSIQHAEPHPFKLNMCTAKQSGEWIGNIMGAFCTIIHSNKRKRKNSDSQYNNASLEGLSRCCFIFFSALGLILQLVGLLHTFSTTFATLRLISRIWVLG